MWKGFRSAGFLLAAALWVGLPQPAQACACCGDQDVYARSSSRATTQQWAELAALVFEGRVSDTLFEEAVWLGKQVKGRFGPQTHLLDLQLFEQGRSVGTVQIQFQAKQQTFEAHLSALLPPAAYAGLLAAEPELAQQLYKEWHFQGTVSASTLPPVWGLKVGEPVNLLLSGHGNRCFALESYRQWRLSFDAQSVEGPETVLLRGQI